MDKSKSHLAELRRNLKPILEYLHGAAREFYERNPDGKVTNPLGERPQRPTSTSKISRYREELTRFIEQNTGIRLPVDPQIRITFYEEVAKSVGL